jgi:hypothetical protein
MLCHSGTARSAGPGIDNHRHWYKALWFECGKFCGYGFRARAFRRAPE